MEQIEHPLLDHLSISGPKPFRRAAAYFAGCKYRGKRRSKRQHRRSSTPCVTGPDSGHNGVEEESRDVKAGDWKKALQSHQREPHN
jgi:hypothetical protein